MFGCMNNYQQNKNKTQGKLTQADDSVLGSIFWRLPSLGSLGHSVGTPIWCECVRACVRACVRNALTSRGDLSVVNTVSLFPSPLFTRNCSTMPLYPPCSALNFSQGSLERWGPEANRLWRSEIVRRTCRGLLTTETSGKGWGVWCVFGAESSPHSEDCGPWSLGWVTQASEWKIWRRAVSNPSHRH